MNQRIVMAAASGILVAAMAMAALHVRHAVAEQQFQIAHRVQGRDQVRFLEKTLDLEPGMTEARLQLVRDLMVLGLDDRALTHLSRLIHSRGAHMDMAELFLYQGEALYHLHRPAEAVSALRSAVQLHDDSSRSHLYLARALADAGQDAESLSELQTAIDASPPEEEAFLDLGARLLRTGADTTSLQHRMLHSGPELAMDWYRLEAGSALNQHRPDVAIRQMKLAAAANPTSNRPHLELAAILQKQEKTREALRECELAVRVEPTPEARLRLASSLESDRQWDRAVHEYRLLEEAQPQEFAKWVAARRGPDPQNPALLAWQEQLETLINPGDVRLMPPGSEPGIQQAWYAGDEGKHETNLKLANALYLQGAFAQGRHDYTAAGQFYENALHFIPVAYSDRNTPFSNKLRESIEVGADSVLKSQLQGDGAGRSRGPNPNAGRFLGLGG